MQEVKEALEVAISLAPAQNAPRLRASFSPKRLLVIVKVLSRP